MHVSISLAAAAVALICSGCAAPYRTAGTPSPTPRSATVVHAPSATVAIGAEQAAMIRAYYDAGSSRGRGRGRNGLPPGIERNLQRGKPLPPGIAKQYLPADLLARLPAAPTGLEYVVVAGKLLLVEAATQVVRQVLLDVVI